MARTPLTVKIVPALEATSSLDLEWTIADVANGNLFQGTGRELVLVRNASLTDPATVIMPAVARYHDFSESIPAGKMHILPMPTLRKYGQLGRVIWLNASSTDLSFLILRLPT